jgi:hypothetical protein
MYSPITGTGNGTAPVVNLTWPWLDKENVKARVNGANVTLNWTGPSQVTFAAVVANAAAWEVYRDTAILEPATDFTDNSVLTATDLDRANLQHLYREQEMAIAAAQGLLPTSTFLGNRLAYSAAPQALTAAQAAALLPLATNVSKGLLPNWPNNTTTFLRGDGTYAVPPVNTGPQGPPGDVSKVATRAALAAETVGPNLVRWLTEAGRSGLFKFVASNFAALVTADTAQGVYVAPASDTTGATGAWVRQFDNALIFDWFGAVPGDYTTGPGADSLPAWNAMQSYLDAVDRNVSAAFVANGPKIYFPGAQYTFSDKVVVNRALHLIGQGGSISEATWLRWTGGTGGIVINRGGSTFAGEVSSTGGDGSMIEGFTLQGPGGTPVGIATTDLLHSAVRFKGRAVIKNCLIRNWRGVGLAISASTSDPVSSAFYGNINGVVVDNVRIESTKFGGVWVSGGDANVINLTNVDVAECGRFGFWLDPFLGLTLVNCQSAHCGLPSHSGLTEYSIVHLAGVQYYAKFNATTAALQAETPGTGSNWIRYGVGGASADIPTWTGLHTYVPGGSYGGTGAFTSLSGCYYETGQAPPQLPNALSFGGFMGSGVSDLPQFFAGSTGIGTNKKISQTFTYTDASSVSASLGGAQTANYFDLLNWNSTAATSGFDPARAYGLVIEKATNDLIVQVDGAAANAQAGFALPFRFTSDVTTQTFGRSAAVPGALALEFIALGPAGNRTVFTTAVASPTGPHAQGEYAFNRGITAATPLFAWATTVAGNPGTQTPLYALTAAPATIATSGSASDLSAGTVPAARMPALTGDVTTVAGAVATTIANGVVTYAKMQNVSATARLLGRTTAGAGVIEEISLAGGLAFAGSTLTAAGALTPTSVASTGAITSSGTGGVGYATGAGAAVTQLTSKSTAPPAINKPTGQITMNNAALAAAGVVSFTVSNSTVAATDTINLNLASGNATSGTYRYWIDKVSAGSFIVTVENRSAGSLSEALVFNFAVLKGVAA